MTAMLKGPQEPHMWVKVVERMLELGEVDQVLRRVLYPMMDLAEEEARELAVGVAPWAYWKTASLHRDRKEWEEEAAVLRRFSTQRHAPGTRTQKLLARMARIEGRATT